MGMSWSLASSPGLCLRGPRPRGHCLRHYVGEERLQTSGLESYVLDCITVYLATIEFRLAQLCVRDHRTMDFLEPIGLLS